MNQSPDLPPPVRTPSRLRAIARRCLFAAAVLATAAAFVWTEENWRAARDWAACQRDVAARDERLDLTAMYDPLPPERNLARAPLFTDGFTYTVDAASGLVTFTLGDQCHLPHLDHMPNAPEYSRSGGALVSSVYRGERLDLRAWQTEYREHAADFGLAPVADGAPLPAPAEDVLRALTTFSPVLDEAGRSAALMPTGALARGPVSYGGGIPSATRRIVQTLALRADARLALGQSAAAGRDLELILWLRQATASEPHSFLNAALGCNHLDMALQVVWEGLADHRWTAAELAGIQRQLEGIDLLADYRHAASGQRAEFLFFADGLLAGRYKLADLYSMGDGWKARVLAWALLHGPRGWLVQNQVGMTRFYQNYLLESIDVPAHRFYPDRLKAGFDVLERLYASPVWPWRYLMAVGIPGFLRVVERSALAQTALDEAVTACAVERHALAHGGSLPATLDALVPPYLDHVPTSVMDGTPLRYTPTPDGRYRLAARHPLRETEKPAGSMVQGDDLVWSYPSAGRF